MRHTILLCTVVALLAAACGGASGGADDPVAAGGDGSLPRCSDLDPVAVPEELFGDTPVYVGNEQPVEEVQAWASSYESFQEVWIDRDHNGWLVVGFTGDVEEVRAAAAERFPDDGVVVVEVERSLDELLALQEQAHERSSLVAGSSSDVRLGRVELYVPRLTDEVVAELAAEFSGEPVCLEGGDAADAPPPGDQPTEGEGWRLLAAEQGSSSYAFMTGIATTPEQVSDALTTVGLFDRDVDIDLETEVLVWFGEAHGSSCPERRLDDIEVTSGDDPVLRPVIVDPTDPMACTSDLVGAWAFVVAVDRAVLPAGPFTIRLTDRPQPIQDEATFVDADLSRPGATVGAGDVRAPEPDRKDGALRFGGHIEPGFPGDYVLYVHCGVGALGELNDVFWVSEDESLWYGEIPEPWQDLADEDQELVVEVLLETGDPPVLVATLNGHSVTYVPGDPADHGCD